jgi:hypothetical protein
MKRYFALALLLGLAAWKFSYLFPLAYWLILLHAAKGMQL